MSFFSSLFGKDSQRYAQESSAAAKQNLTTGYDLASKQLGENRDTALSALTGGYGSARTKLTDGYGAARTDFNTGIDAAKGTTTDYLGRSTAYLDPWIKSGVGNQKILDDYAGVNGTGAQTSMYDSFATQNNPLVAARNAKVAADAAAAANARGSLNGGRALLAATRTGQQMAADDLQRYISNVNNSAQRGYGASTQAAGLTQQAGDVLSNLENQRGRGLSDLSTQLARGQADLDTGEAGAKASIWNSQGNTLANLTSGYYNALAGNDINTGSAMATASQMGVNNLLGLAGTAVRAFTPLPTGGSAFTNLLSAATSPFRPSSTTTPGTKFNDGWETTTTRAPFFSNWG